MLATLQTVMGKKSMNKEYRTILMSYINSVLQAKKMLKQNIISAEDYAEILSMLEKTHKITKRSSYYGVDYIYERIKEITSHWGEST